MAFKLYTDKSSLDQPYSRLVLGGTVDVLDNGQFLGWWEKDEFPTATDDIKFTVTLQYQGRPDKISYFMYGREDLQWLVLQYNNIVDINEELVTGAVLTLPSYQRALYSLTST